jgi:hypothetical protein
VVVREDTPGDKRLVGIGRRADRRAGHGELSVGESQGPGDQDKTNGGVRHRILLSCGQRHR